MHTLSISAERDGKNFVILRRRFYRFFLNFHILIQRVLRQIDARVAKTRE